MSLSVLVTNQPPISSSDVPRSLLELFQLYARTTNGQAYVPFEHQAQTFHLVAGDKEIFLVAGKKISLSPATR